MTVSRRGFLASILTAAVAPAAVRASSLMKMVPTESGLLVPYGLEYPITVGSGLAKNAGDYIVVRRWLPFKRIGAEIPLHHHYEYEDIRVRLGSPEYEALTGRSWFDKGMR